MKKLHWLFMAICLAVMPVLQSCDDNDDGYSIGDFTPPLWATVRVKGSAFYLDCDRWGTLWPVNSIGWYEPADGQRVITVFNPLYDNYEGYDHAVKILSMQNVLTKEVEILTPENEKEFGNDPVLIYKGDIGISGGYMNIIFAQNLPSKTKHRISLVGSPEIENLAADDGYIRLELRYNDYDDLTGRRGWSAVSYNLNSLNITSATKGIKLKINSEVNKEVELTFELKDFGTNPQKPVKEISKMQLQ